MEGIAPGVCALQELFGNDLWPKMAPVLPQPPVVEAGGISWTPGSRACIILERAFLLITYLLSPLISYGPLSSCPEMGSTKFRQNKDVPFQV